MDGSLSGFWFVSLERYFFLTESPTAGPNGKYCPDIMQIFAPTNDETCLEQSARYVGDIKAQ